VRRVLSERKPGEVGKHLGINRQTVDNWSCRYVAQGVAGLEDRSARPHAMPRATSPETTAMIVKLRGELYAGLIRIAAKLGLSASIVGAVTCRGGLPHLADLDRVTGEVIRVSTRRSNMRYEHPNPADLLHVDVKKLGRIPDGGGWRIHGQAPSCTARHGVVGTRACRDDDHSRVAYVEVLGDETGDTCAGFLHQAFGWFRDRGVIIRRVLTDNEIAYRLSKSWAAFCSALQIKRRFTKPGCPLDERQSRASELDPANGMGLLKTSERQRRRPDRRTCSLGQLLQH
jgi:hypothetical protein